MSDLFLIVYFSWHYLSDWLKCITLVLRFVYYKNVPTDRNKKQKCERSKQIYPIVLEKINVTVSDIANFKYVQSF